MSSSQHKEFFVARCSFGAALQTFAHLSRNGRRSLHCRSLQHGYVLADTI